jgi:hypothetical protein
MNGIMSRGLRKKTELGQSLQNFTKSSFDSRTDVPQPDSTGWPCSEPYRFNGMAEAQLHSKLNLPRAGGKVRLPFLGGRLAEPIPTEGEVPRRPNGRRLNRLQLSARSCSMGARASQGRGGETPREGVPETEKLSAARSLSMPTQFYLPLRG